MLVLCIIILGVIFAIPSILYKEDTGNWFLDNKINLDLTFEISFFTLVVLITLVVFIFSLSFLMQEDNIEVIKNMYSNLITY